MSARISSDRSGSATDGCMPAAKDATKADDTTGADDATVGGRRVYM